MTNPDINESDDDIDNSSSEEESYTSIFNQLIQNNLNNHNNDFNYKYDYFTIEICYHSYETRGYFIAFNSIYYKIILYNKTLKTYKKLYVNFDILKNISNIFNIYDSFNISIDGETYYAYDILDVLCDFNKFEDAYKTLTYTKLGNLTFKNIIYKDFEEEII